MKHEWKANTLLCNVCTTIEAKQRYTDQGGNCPICGRFLGPQDSAGDNPTAAQLDHDHVGGQLRGVLCRKCNMGLGQFDDNPAVLRVAAEYLERWATRGQGTSEREEG